MKIISGPGRTPSGQSAPAALGRRHARAAATAIVGLIVLAAAHSMPWVAVRPGQSTDDLLLGRPPSGEVRTYALTDFPGSRASLYVGWVLLLVMLVAAWVRPRWRPGARLGAGVLGVALTLFAFLSGGDAVDASGFPRADHPQSEFLAGIWLAVAGTLLLAAAVPTLAAAPKAPVEARPTPAEPAPLSETAPATPPAPAFAPGPHRTATRPAQASWWRRPGPVIGVAAAVAAAAIVGTVVWYAVHARAGQDRDLGALVVAIPADSTPTTPAAVDDQVNITRILPLGEDFRSLMLVAAVRNTVQHAAGAAWTRPDSASVTVTLLQFDSVSAADQFQQSYVDLQPPAGGLGNLVEIPDVPGALTFTDEDRTEVRGVARRNEIIVLVSVGGGPPDAVTTVESLVREQYGRL
ncbi:hypothetical protein RMN56_09320 [Micromonospora halotolerans]|uniref:Uncharacterized protein n=1 Tax=Micromonospora halotolerans TaxID=709879 RepID=A0ABZ0A280_9ACTN|nr:hypothetical protein [Micromonospora halotolerans]WNM41519.1 hypothetical protein RMN56_09320 [Micromonospora halotolerans]